MEENENVKILIEERAWAEANEDALTVADITF